MRTFEFNPTLLGLEFKNNASARSHGLEMWGSWQAKDDLKISGGLVVQDVQIKTPPGDFLQAIGLGSNDPSSHSLLRVSYDINPKHLLDATVRHMGKLNNPVVPAYTAIDIRYGWKIDKNLEFSLVGQNLLDAKHAEFSIALSRPEYDRSLFAKVEWYFR